ncbi:hypothetical protein L3N51_01020 [Metallosphaera sp. J1]|nr:hypothetical protein [Metallosphaera javensis (ex Hofmann et al. 2022)]
MGTDRKLFDDSYRFMKHYLKRAEKGFINSPMAYLRNILITDLKATLTLGKRK